MSEIQQKIGPVLSPVDYDAWQRGYMPPSEHVLIDELSYRGARVVSSLQTGGFSFWLVIKGDVNRKRLSAISLRLHQDMDALQDEEPVPSPPEEGRVLKPDDRDTGQTLAEPDASVEPS